MNEHLRTAVDNIVESIQAACLGSIEMQVIDAAVRALIAGWNDHNKYDQINEEAELAIWTAQ